MATTSEEEEKLHFEKWKIFKSIFDGESVKLMLSWVEEFLSDSTGRCCAINLNVAFSILILRL
jgi:hypothetical protein